MGPEAGHHEGQPAPIRVARRRRTVDTPAGRVVLCTAVTPAALTRLDPDVGLAVISPADVTHRHLLRIASHPLGSVTTAVEPRSSLLVGYLAVHPADPETRWGRSGPPCLLELGALETSPLWRGQGLSTGMVDLTFADPAFADRIVISNEYSWHWDLGATGLSKWAYRVVLRRLLGRAGFVELLTDEPNIRWDPANIFMVRVGPAVDATDLLRFGELLFLDGPCGRPGWS